MADIIEKAQRIIKPVVESLGFEVVEIEYKKMYGENNLTVYVYKKDGISLDECEAVNNALDPVLDLVDISEGQTYNLNISSPGLDRLVKSEDDFRRSLDTELELLFVENTKKKSTHGILVAYDAASITLKQKDKDTKYDRTNISTVRPYIDFK